MIKILFADQNGKYKRNEKISQEFGYIKSEDVSENVMTPWGICVGGLTDVKEAERIKKIIIKLKVDGAFVFISPDIGEDGELFSHCDKALVKKLKELCLFANAVYMNFTEACAFANLVYKEKCNKEDAECLIFKLNAFGMANKLIITDFPNEDGTKSLIVSEFGECELLSQNGNICEKEELSAYILLELSKGEKIIPSVKKSLEQI